MWPRRSVCSEVGRAAQPHALTHPARFRRSEGARAILEPVRAGERAMPWSTATAMSLGLSVLATAACGGGIDNGGGVYAPCSPDARLGGFWVQLVHQPADAPYTSVNGAIRNVVHPQDVWQQKGAAVGDCKLMVGPTLECNPGCTSPQICGGPNQCIDQPMFQSAGTVTLSGVGPASITMEPLLGYYSTAVTDPYPPFSPGAIVRLQAAGATIPAFALAASAIAPLVFDGSNLTMRGGEPLAFTWTPALPVSAARVVVKVEIGHNGGVAAIIECDVPDTGSAEIPAPLVSALIAEGAHGDPTITLTRRSISSTSDVGGCVELGVISSVKRPITVCPTPSTCIVTCWGDSVDECPAPMTCHPDLTCS